MSTEYCIYKDYFYASVHLSFHFVCYQKKEIFHVTNFFFSLGRLHLDKAYTFLSQRRFQISGLMPTPLIVVSHQKTFCLPSKAVTGGGQGGTCPP